MIKFRQKDFTEHDAMKILYRELVIRAQGDRRKYPKLCTPSSLLPILKGQNIVIERFVISSSTFGKDKYRMYIKIGAKAKLPESVRLPGEYRTQTVGDLGVTFNAKVKSFADNNNNNNGKKKDGGGGDFASSRFSPNVRIQREVKKILGEVIKYNKTDRSLVLEFEDLGSAIKALDILPFGLEYNIYLLDA